MSLSGLKKLKKFSDIPIKVLLDYNFNSPESPLAFSKLF